VSPEYVAPEVAPDPDDEYCPDPMPIPEQPASMVTRAPSASFPIMILLFGDGEKARQNYHVSVLGFERSAANIEVDRGNTFFVLSWAEKKTSFNERYGLCLPTFNTFFLPMQWS
jgi:hypothetical protein